MYNQNFKGLCKTQHVIMNLFQDLYSITTSGFIDSDPESVRDRITQ